MRASLRVTVFAVLVAGCRASNQLLAFERDGITVELLDFTMDNYGVVEEWNIKVTNCTRPMPCNVRVRLGYAKSGEVVGTFEANIWNLSPGVPASGTAHRVEGGAPAGGETRLIDVQILNERLGPGSP